MKRTGRLQLLAIIGPGLLVAATGIGAGDLATAAFTGSRVGTAVLWAVVVGAFLKFVLNEGLARWQLATGETLLEGAVRRFGFVVAAVFLPYFLVWTFLVALALMSACGVTMHALVPLFSDAEDAKIAFGILHGAAGVVLVLLGGFRLFEKVMSVCIGVMFLTVVVTTLLIWPGTTEVLRGLLVPARATLRGESLGWTVALMGGVGGTVTVLCYGYWIREKGRAGGGDLRICRIDLGVAYAMTAVFGVCMVIIGSTLPLPEKGGAGLIVDLAAQLEGPLGPVGKWAFLIGVWGAVFSSLLGVWQAIPYLFTDLWFLLRRRFREGPGEVANRVDYTRSRPYRAYLLALAIVPVFWLGMPFSMVQKAYAISGALFIPMLAVTLLVLNGRRGWVGDRFRNRRVTAIILLLATAFFAWLLIRAIFT